MASRSGAMLRNRSSSKLESSSPPGEGENGDVLEIPSDSAGFHFKVWCCPFMPLLSVLAVAAVFVVAVHTKTIDLCSLLDNCNSVAERELDEFCSGHVASGDEGLFRTSSAYRLQHVVMNIRHGDRSTLFHIPGLIQHADLGSNGINSKEVKFMRNLSAFRLQPLEDYQHDFPPPLDAARLDELASKPMEQGKLTVNGFNQHITLGKHLKSAYADLLRQIKSPDQIFIRSTNFERTIQSAAALMLGMVPRLTRPGRSKDLVIHYHPYKRDEAMHGVGIRQKSGLNLCRRAVEARSAQFRSNKTFDVHLSSQDELVAAFGSDGVEGQRVVDMLDVIFPGYCQGGHAPCVFRKEMDKPSCLSLEAFADLKRRGDEDFCNTYGGLVGGELSSRLAMYPFLLQVKRALFHAADLDLPIPEDNFVNNMGKVEKKLGVDRSFGSKLERDILQHRQTPKEQRSPERDIKFTLYSGHDTVIAPVLAALGVYDRYCTWPPYASHIMFELWKNERAGSFKRTGNETVRDFYVRVLFNGKDVTRHIPECKIAAETARFAEQNARFKQRSKEGSSESVISKGNARSDTRRLDELGAITHYPLHEPPPKYRDPTFERMYDGTNLCSLQAFAKQIDGLLDGASSMTEACHAH